MSGCGVFYLTALGFEAVIRYDVGPALEAPLNKVRQQVSPTMGRSLAAQKDAG